MRARRVIGLSAAAAAAAAASTWALGCGGPPGEAARVTPADGGAADSGRDGLASDDGGSRAADASVDAPGASQLVWSQGDPAYPDGDITSIWGSTGATYVATDMATVYVVDDRGVRMTVFGAAVAGAGWSSDPASVYAVAGSSWLAPNHSSAGLFLLGTSTWHLAMGSATYYAVWGSSPDDLYVAGSDGVSHSTGGAAFTTETPASALTVWGSGPSDVFASTANPVAIIHSAGDGVWTTVHSVAAGMPWAGWSSAPGDAYAVVSPVMPADPDGVVVHSADSGDWVTESVGQPGVHLVAVWGSGPHDVYAGGYHPGASGLVGDLFHSTGDGTWSRVALPGDVYEVTCVWGTSATDVYVGVYDRVDGPLVLRGRQ